MKPNLDLYVMISAPMHLAVRQRFRSLSVATVKSSPFLIFEPISISERRFFFFTVRQLHKARCLVKCFPEDFPEKFLHSPFHCEIVAHMDINSLTIGEARELSAMFSKPANEHPFNIGANYFIRTVTHHLTGTLVQVGPQELVLTGAAWIADDGRFMEAVAESKFSEVEPFPADKKVIVGRASIIDAVEIKTMPTSQK